MKTRDLLFLTASVVTLCSASGVHGGLSKDVGLAIPENKSAASSPIPDSVEPDVQQALLLPALPNTPFSRNLTLVAAIPVEASAVAYVTVDPPALARLETTPFVPSAVAVPDSAATALTPADTQIPAATGALRLIAGSLEEAEPGERVAGASTAAVTHDLDVLAEAIKPDMMPQIASGYRRTDLLNGEASAEVIRGGTNLAINVAPAGQKLELQREVIHAVRLTNSAELVAGGTEASANAAATVAAVVPSERQAVASKQQIQSGQRFEGVFLPDAPEYVSYAEAASADTPVSSVGVGAAGLYTDANGTVSLENAISAALESNPEINQAIFNKEAIEFEREQAQGLFLPRVDLEASVGARRLENPTRRTLGIEENVLYPVEGALTASQTLVDFGRRDGELRRQAARTDGAALRVVERSQNVALLVSRQYLNILLQQRIFAAADDNVTFHRSLVGDLGQGVAQGSISIADQQQAEERLQAAVVRKAEAEEGLIDAQITLQTLTGLRIDGGLMPRSLRAAAPPTLDEAVAAARLNNPKVQEAIADVDAAHALASKEKGDLAPIISAEISGRGGHDIDGFTGRTTDVQGRIVLRWNLFDGGINRAKYQEMVRRASEARYRMHEMTRLAEQDAQRAWNSMTTQAKISEELAVQNRVSDDLLLSYRQQFNVGRRSLLDVLDAQNTRYNVQVRLETARFSKQFAEYQVLAATNELLNAMGLSAPASGTSNAREKYQYGPSEPAELQRRRHPR